MDWAKHTTVFAAIVAAVGLAVTAWGTLKSAQVANDQLAQSRKARADEERAQAARVTEWREGDWYVVANRSSDPVFVNLWFHWGTSRESAYTFYGPQGVALDAIPPCQAVKVPTAAIDKFLKSQFHPSGRDASGRDTYWYELMEFIDADGRWWERTVGGELRHPDGDAINPQADQLIATRKPTLEQLGAKRQGLDCRATP
ncbi:hypothetical protein AB0907_38945 [Streptomyces sp. NPDC006975]|uniref:hypothetical protein n=1 Tax=Streptomyces sp. NPDC006975 TaxID=3154310 RepID=UPI003454B6AD